MHMADAAMVMMPVTAVSVRMPRMIVARMVMIGMRVIVGHVRKILLAGQAGRSSSSRFF